MTMNYDLDQLMGVYADWIAWLREKERSLESQLAKMRSKQKADHQMAVTAAPGESAEEEPLPEPASVSDETAPTDAPSGDGEDGEAQPDDDDEDEDDWL